MDNHCWVPQPIAFNWVASPNTEGVAKGDPELTRPIAFQQHHVVRATTGVEKVFLGWLFSSEAAIGRKSLICLQSSRNESLGQVFSSGFRGRVRSSRNEEAIE